MAFVFRQLLPGAGGGGEEGDDEEEAALLEYEGGLSSSSEEEETADEEEEAVEEPMSNGGEDQFDISLPAQHLYLGDLEEEGHAHMEDVETTPLLPLLCLPTRVLFPGETLPMHIYNPHIIEMLRNASTSNKPVALCTDLRTRRDNMRRPRQEELGKVGTTAEILAFREEESQFWGPCFVVKFLGRQRFMLAEVLRRMNGLMEARVRILSELELPPRPLELFVCPAHIYSGCLATQMAARVPECTIHTAVQLQECRKRLESPRLSPSICPVPSWVFRFYDTDYLRSQLLQEQRMMTFSDHEEGRGWLPEDTISLSYWLARRLPIDDTQKLELLSLHCPTRRLIRGMQILQEFTVLCCKNCNTIITHKEHIFSMSVDGPLAAYVNPGGYVHDTLTVTEASNVRRQGRATTEHSWFPGYRWTIMNCRTCGDHKGWCFEATKRSLRPARFFGLRRPSLMLKDSTPPQSVS